MIQSFSRDISERLKLEKELIEFKDQLEDKVKQRTADLSNILTEVKETVNVIASSSAQILAATTQVASELPKLPLRSAKLPQRWRRCNRLQNSLHKKRKTSPTVQTGSSGLSERSESCGRDCNRYESYPGTNGFNSTDCSSF